MSQDDRTGPDLEALAADLLFARQVEAFLFREAGMLDDGDVKGWLDLFAGDGFYWVPSDPAQDSPFDGESLFYGNLAAMRTQFAGGPSANGVLLSRVVSNAKVENRNDRLGACEVSARFVLVGASPSGASFTIGGRYDYALLREGESGFRIAAKRVSPVGAAALTPPLDFPL